MEIKPEQQIKLLPEIRGLTLTQPWATLVAIGAKKIETRTWSTNYRGLVAIHAAKNFPGWARELCKQEPFRTALVDGYGYNVATLLPRGQIVAVASIVDVVGTASPILKMNLSGQERAFGDYSPGRWAWILKNIKAVVPRITCRGSLSLWQVSYHIVEQLHERGLLAQ